VSQETARRATLVAGSAVVIGILAGSRWFTHIGVAPLYIADFLLGCAILNYVLQQPARRGAPLVEVAGVRQTRFPTALLGWLVAWAALRGLFAFQPGYVVDWARDLAPYLYPVAGYLGARSYSVASEHVRQRTAAAFTVALSIHLAWCSVAVATNNIAGIAVGRPFNANVFQVRHDFDGVLIAILVGLCTRAIIAGRRRGLAFIGVLIGTPTVLMMASRAAFLALLFAMFVGAILSLSASRGLTRDKLLLLAVLPFVAAAVVGLALTTTPGQRLLATVNPEWAASAEQRNALGTMGARQEAWSLIAHWVSLDPWRVLFGSGFGNDFLDQSGSLGILQGTDYDGVRSPHNYLVGSYARIGILGLLLITVLVAIVLFRIARLRRAIGNDDLLSFCALAIVATLPASMVGVVLEAPFGAILFFWAAGVLTSVRPAVDRVHAEAKHFRKRNQAPSPRSSFRRLATNSR